MTLAVVAIAALVTAQRLPDRPCGEFARRSSRSPASCGGYAFGWFEFAPVSGGAGTGMGTACACTNPTGAKGEALTFTRTTAATCTKGNTSSGIVAGDLVYCSANQARVMPGGDGTGGLGLLVESAATNLSLRSAELDNAAWSKIFGGGGSIPTVTADYAVAPDGSTTAERVQVSACSSVGDYSVLQQTGLGGTGTYTSSLYCRGTSATQTISICANDFNVAGDKCVQVSCPSTSWTRVSATTAITGGGGQIVGCINLAAYAGSGSTGAADVLLWGGQFQATPYMTSYIPTAGTSASIGAEDATFDMGAGQLIGSVAFTRAADHANNVVAGSQTVFISLQDAVSSATPDLYVRTNGSFLKCDVPGASATVASNSANGGRSWCSLTPAGAVNASIEGATATSSGGGYDSYRYIKIGGGPSTGYADSVIKGVIVERTTTGAR